MVPTTTKITHVAPQVFLHGPNTPPEVMHQPHGGKLDVAAAFAAHSRQARRSPERLHAQVQNCLANSKGNCHWLDVVAAFAAHSRRVHCFAIKGHFCQGGPEVFC